jgi:hypothetical protein
MFHISVRCIGPIMAFGAGVLIRAVAFDLVEEAPKTAPANWPIYLACSPAAASSSAGTGSSTAPAGANAKDPTGAQQDRPALAIVLGSVFDGIPGSMAVGLTCTKAARWAARTWSPPQRQPARVDLLDRHGGWSATCPSPGTCRCSWHSRTPPAANCAPGA